MTCGWFFSKIDRKKQIRSRIDTIASPKRGIVLKFDEFVFIFLLLMADIEYIYIELIPPYYGLCFLNKFLELQGYSHTHY